MPTIPASDYLVNRQKRRIKATKLCDYVTTNTVSVLLVSWDFFLSVFDNLNHACFVHLLSESGASENEFLTILILLLDQSTRLNLFKVLDEV